MRLFYFPAFVSTFLWTCILFAQSPVYTTKTESNAIFVKIKDASNERILYPNPNKEIVLDMELKKIIETYKIRLIAPAFHTTEKSDARLKRVYTVSFPVSAQKEAIMNSIRKLPFVDYVEMIPLHELFLTPNDLNTLQWNLPKINAEAAWNISTGAGKVIAIVDDAVRLTHEDLAANIWNNPLEIAGNGVDDDNNGYIDDVHGYDVADNDNDPMVPLTATNSDFTHGTHCSGIAAAVSNNRKGIASIGYNNRIMAVKCKQSADVGASLPFAYSGLAYAIDAGADVISMSWGGYYYSATYQLLFDVAYDAGIICVAAAGNSDIDIPMYPASYNHVISVAATDQNDERASFSNYGQTIDVCAPGVDIYSTLAGSNNSYGRLSGTSMACPLVSGLCALMLSYSPSLTPDEVEHCLKDNADNIDDKNPGFISVLGAGRINAYKTMLCLQKSITADFKSDKQFVCPGQTVTYTDMSWLGSNSNTKWSWSFPGGVPVTSSNQNPKVVYNMPGKYTATLTVTNSLGTSVEKKINYITVNPLTATLSGNASIPSGGNALLKVDFSNVEGPYSIVYTDGVSSFTKTNITSNPYYFTVTPAITSIYRLTAISTDFCTGAYSGNAEIIVNTSGNSSCSGPAPSMFERAYGDATDDYGATIIQSSTGENYLIGSNSMGTSSSDFFISKLNASWDIQWTKKIGTGAAEFIYYAIKSPDGNIMLCGTSAINGSLDGYIAKIDFNGNILWSKTYGGAQNEYIYTIKTTSDGGYVLSGRAESYAIGLSYLDSYIVKIDANGTLQWSKAFGRSGNDYALTCEQTPDGGYITASASQRVANTNYDYLITKLDASGNIVWSKYFGSSDDEGPRTQIITSSGDFLFIGSSRYRSSITDGMLTKLDASGNLLWTKVFGGDGFDDTYIVSEDADGNYLVLGATDSFGAGLKDILFSKFDTNGNILWSKVYGGAQNENFPSLGSVSNTSDGGYAIVATTASFGAGQNDLYLIKTDCNGNTNCSSKEVVLEKYPTAITLNNVTLAIQNAPGTSNPVSATNNLNFAVTSVCNVTNCTINADFYSNDTTVCKGTVVNFTSTSTGATTYKWYIDNVLIGQNTTTIAHTFSTVGDYEVMLIADNTNCSESHVLTIHVKDFPQIIVSKDTIICNTTSAYLSVSGAATYNWTNTQDLSCTICTNPVATPVHSGYYYVVGTDINGCESKDSVKVVVKCCVAGKFSPKASFSFSDSIICVNDAITITNLSYTSLNNVDAKWDFSSAGQPQYSTALQPGDITFTKSGRWPVKLIITDDCGIDSIINYINVFNPPVVNAYPDMNVCPSKQGTQFNITPISDYSYSWIPAFGLSDAAIANPWVNISDTSILYQRTIKDNITGCEATDFVKVSSHTSKIHAMNDTTIVGGEEVKLKACCGNYMWWPATYLNNVKHMEPIATPTESIWYYVQSVDSIGCVVRDSVLITVVVLEPFIPNLITPNGDQLNDTFEILHLCPDSQVEIYNRWGELVYESSNYKNDWNAKDDSEGMYYVSFKNGCGGKIYKSWLQVLGGN